MAVSPVQTATPLGASRTGMVQFMQGIPSRGPNVGDVKSFVAANNAGLAQGENAGAKTTLAQSNASLLETRGVGRNVDLLA